MKSVTLGIVIGSLACSSTAQATHVVGPGGYAEIADAAAVAASGDVILVHPGNYLSFGTTRGLTIRALVPGSVHVSGGLWSAFAPAAGEELRVVGVGFTRVLTNGCVSLEDCQLIGVGQVLTSIGGQLQLQDCSVVALSPTSPLLNGSAPVQFRDSHVTATNTTVTGAPIFGGVPGGPAVQLIDSMLQGSHVVLDCTGGGPGSVALIADAASSAWLSDSTLSSPTGTCPIAGGSVRVDRCSVSPACGSFTNGFVLGARRVQPLQQGQAFTIELRAGAGAMVAVLANWERADVIHPYVEQPIGVSGSAAWVATVLVANAAGVASGTWPIPADPALIDRALWLQGFSGTTLPVQASPVVGGVIR